MYNLPFTIYHFLQSGQASLRTDLYIVHGKWYMRLFYIIIMPHHITDALGEQVWHEGESYEAYYVWRSIAKRVGIEYAQLIYYVIMAQREEP